MTEHYITIQTNDGRKFIATVEDVTVDAEPSSYSYADGTIHRSKEWVFEVDALFDVDKNEEVK